MLSVHGQRADGFHALTSLVVALKFGDTLTIRSGWHGGCTALLRSDGTVGTRKSRVEGGCGVSMLVWGERRILSLIWTSASRWVLDSAAAAAMRQWRCVG